MVVNDELEQQRRFLETVRLAILRYAELRGLRDITDGTEIEFPSASVDAEGRPRFKMSLAAGLMVRDLGAAHVFYFDVVRRGFEFPLRRFLDLHLESDDVFIDVGAHWGIHSLTAATVLPHQVSVIAIEPHPDNHATLCRWVALNRLEDDVEVISRAASDHHGKSLLWRSGSSMGHTLRTQRQEPGSVPSEVDVTTIDRIVEERPRLAWRRFLLKIDVEGNELEVLTGARDVFAREHVAAVIWEKSAFHEPVEQARRDRAIWEFLDSRGFRHFRMEDEMRGGPLVAIDNRDIACNVFSVAADVVPKQSYD